MQILHFLFLCQQLQCCFSEQFLRKPLEEGTVWRTKKYILFVTQKRFQRPWNIVVGPQFYAPLQVQLVLYCALLCSFSGRQLVVNPSILHHFIQCSTKQYIVFILHHPGCSCICICITVYRKAVDVFAVAFCTYLRLIAERTLNAVLTSQNDSIIS